MRKQVFNPANEETTLYYSLPSRLGDIYQSNGIRTSTNFNADETINWVRHKNSGGTDLHLIWYKYDKAGNRTEANDWATGEITTYTYDATYRLINEHHTGSSSYNTTHTYDPVGNRLYKDEDGERTTFTYDEANQLATSTFPAASNNEHVYTYDGAGNLKKDQITGFTSSNFTWNAENQLTQIQLGAADPVGYLYNGDALRVQYIEGETPDYLYVWDQNNLLMEKSYGGSTLALYTYNPLAYGNLLSQRRSSTSHWPLLDALGCVIGLTDNGENITDTYLNSAYGEAVTKTGTTVNPFRWLGRVGYYHDGVLHYVRARYYNAALARWMSRDPMGFVGSRWNLYEYVYSRPIVAVDPSGLQYPYCPPVCPPGTIWHPILQACAPPIPWQDCVEQLKDCTDWCDRLRAKGSAEINRALADCKRQAHSASEIAGCYIAYNWMLSKLSATHKICVAACYTGYAACELINLEPDIDGLSE